AAADALTTVAPPRVANEAAAAAAASHVVADGEDVYSISLKYDTTPLELRKLNPGRSLVGLQPGDTIVVPAAN
ncbi:MAG: LysM peptidoglycan-binding domain-containing protein, partial [Kiritimatiellae bacterium]|nr:LysM peptidoglycan-binding domain-containing protein [Kiritimatiellia bacterium]